MGVGTSIARLCKQKAVYWGNPVNDGFGGHTFDSPIEIDCRWEDKNETFITPYGEEAVSKSIVYCKIDVDQDGYLFLGTLDDIYDSLESSAATIDPKELNKAYIIRRFDKVPAINPADGFLRKAYLTSKNMV